MTEIDYLIKQIQKGIEAGKEPEYFTQIIKKLSEKTKFLAAKLENDYMFRVRKMDESSLFTHINELKYPPNNIAKKGRLNKKGESIMYLSLGEISPLAELDISYYEIHCLIKIEYSKKELFFHYAGIKGTYGTNYPDSIKINEFYRDLLINKNKKKYNFTISLGNHFLNTPIKSEANTYHPCGLIYSSAHSEKSNKNLYNLAIKPEVFDKHFRISEVSYHVMTYDENKDLIVIEKLNTGHIDSEGNISWEIELPEMLVDFENKFSTHIFVQDDNIIHHKFRVGKIVGSESEHYLVKFQTCTQKIKKNVVRKFRK